MPSSEQGLNGSESGGGSSRSHGVDGRLVDTLARHAPDHARDGDCSRVANQVTDDLRAQGINAVTVQVWGWMKLDKVGLPPSQRGLAFGHMVTVVENSLVLDGTAQQFDALLPAQWIAPSDEYLGELARATGVQEVTLGWPDPALRDTPAASGAPPVSASTRRRHSDTGRARKPGPHA